MKKRLIFIIPILILLGFLAVKPPAIGSEKKQVVVTPTSTTTSTPLAKPNLRDFGDDGSGPAHRGFGDDGDGRTPPPHIDGQGFPGDGHDDHHGDGDLHQGNDD